MSQKLGSREERLEALLELCVDWIEWKADNPSDYPAFLDQINQEIRAGIPDANIQCYKP